MDDKSALRALKHRDEAALAWFIDRYAAYVNTIVYNIIGGAIGPGKVKAYLSGIARNKAKEKTRRLGVELPLDDDMLIISDTDPERDLELEEQACFLKNAILAMGHPDREIFLRHYYYCQGVAQIADEMDINLSSVKTKLRRGRSKLKEVLCEGGYIVEKENFRYDGQYTG